MKDPSEFLDEDVGTGDITTEALVSGEMAKARILAKGDCVLAGMDVGAGIFRGRGLEVEPVARDGESAKRGQTVMLIEGPAAKLLTSERLVLNFIMRMSGIATVTAELVSRCGAVNPKVRIAATRKTTPGLRKWEKDAVEAGGGIRHREGLYDQYLIKDNHLRIVGSITRAVEMARAHGKSPVVEVEAVDIEGAREAAVAGADIIMLDNMDPERARMAARGIRDINPGITVEVSGGITPDNILGYAEFADVISLGWLTHSAKPVDFALDVVEVRKPSEDNRE